MLPRAEHTHTYTISEMVSIQQRLYSYWCSKQWHSDCRSTNVSNHCHVNYCYNSMQKDRLLLFSIQIVLPLYLVYWVIALINMAWHEVGRGAPPVPQQICQFKLGTHYASQCQRLSIFYQNCSNLPLVMSDKHLLNLQGAKKGWRLAGFVEQARLGLRLPLRFLKLFCHGVWVILIALASFSTSDIGTIQAATLRNEWNQGWSVRLRV